MYEVTDMYFVAALIAYGADYTGVDRADRKSQKFLFKDPIDISEIYTYKKGIVSTIENPTFDNIKHAFDTLTLLFPATYPETVRRIKAIIHA